jgi:zinc protease
MTSLLFLLLVFVLFPIQTQAAGVQIEEVKSPGGITAWLVRDDKLPLIALHMAWRGGVEQDSPDKQGLAHLTADLLTEGAGPYDAEAFQQQLSDHSVKLGFEAGRDSITGTLKMLREERGTGLRLLRLSLTQPRFDDEALARVRQQQLTSLRMTLGNPDWQARHALFDHIFAGHPYAFRSLGTTKTLAALSREDVQNFAASHFARDNLVIAVAGAISPAELAAALDETFGVLPAQAKLTPIPEVLSPSPPATLLVNRSGTQSEILLSLPGPKRDDPDWYAAEVANYILGGGGFSSRLMNAVRDKEGLTYGVNTSLAAMDHAGLILGEIAADNPKVEKALTLISKVWRKLYQEGPSEDEIEAAKNYLTGAMPLTLTSTEAIAGRLVQIQLEHLGRDYFEKRDAFIQQVDVVSVRRVLARWFDPQKMTVVMVGEPEGVTPSEVLEQTKE